ncbi:unnamed protein product, partial [Cyprideis torosa]
MPCPGRHVSAPTPHASVTIPQLPCLISSDIPMQQCHVCSEGLTPLHSSVYSPPERTRGRRKMDLNFVLELVLFCLCFTELLAVDSTKFLKFSGFQCNETSGPAVEGLYDGQCIGKALEDACWAFRVCPDCQCCHTVMEVADSSTFLYSLAHRVIGDPCVSDDHCPFGCVNGICDCDSATILNATKNGCR